MITKTFKRVIVGLFLMMAVFGFKTFITDILPQKNKEVFEITNFENIKYKVSFEDNAVVINNVRYYIKDYDSLIKDIKRAERKDFEETQTIVSDYVEEKDGTYNKYDIYYQNKSEGSTTIVFYKFKDELDDRFDIPTFSIEQLKNILNEGGKWNVY